MIHRVFVFIKNCQKNRWTRRQRVHDTTTAEKARRVRQFGVLIPNLTMPLACFFRFINAPVQSFSKALLLLASSAICASSLKQEYIEWGIPRWQPPSHSLFTVYLKRERIFPLFTRRRGRCIWSIGISGVPRNFWAMGYSLVKRISVMGGHGQLM